MLMMLGPDGRLMLMMLNRGPADADDAWASGRLRLRMLGQGPADAGDARARWPAHADDAETRLMLLMLGPDNRLMLKRGPADAVDARAR